MAIVASTGRMALKDGAIVIAGLESSDQSIEYSTVK